MKRVFASLDTTQVKLVGNLRKCDPAGIMASGKPKDGSHFFEILSLYAILVTSFEV